MTFGRVSETSHEYRVLLVRDCQYVATYIYAPVLSNVPPEVPPDEGIAISVIEGLVLRMLVARGPNGHVRQADSIGIVIYRVVEVLVSWKAWHLPHLFGDQDVQSECDGFRHTVL